MFAEIVLSCGRFFKVDSADLVLVSEYQWKSVERGFTVYVRGYRKEQGSLSQMVYLHRLLLNAQQGVLVDHINGNGLDNTRANLRLATHTQNQQNRVRLQGNNTSGVTGIYWSKTSGVWTACIFVDKKRKHLGSFRDKESAIKARKAAEKEFFGVFAPIG